MSTDPARLLVLRYKGPEGDERGSRCVEPQQVVDALIADSSRAQISGEWPLPPLLMSRRIGTLKNTAHYHGCMPSAYVLDQRKIQWPYQFSLWRGGFGVVRTACYEGRVVAIKQALTRPEDTARQTELETYREAILCCTLHHENIVPFVGIINDDAGLLLVTKLMDNGTICEYLARYPHVDRVRLLTDILQGIVYLHSLGVWHGDLKSSNILVNRSGQACLTDFGLAAIADHEGNAKVRETSSWTAGSTRYMAPELHHPDRAVSQRCIPSAASDVWATAMVMYQTFTDQLPYHSLNLPYAIISAIISGQHPAKPPAALLAERGCSVATWRVMERAWRLAPAQRPSIQELLSTVAVGRPPPVTGPVFRPLPRPAVSVNSELAKLFEAERRGLLGGDKTVRIEVMRSP